MSQRHRVTPNNPVARPGDRTPKAFESTPVVVSNTPPLDAANSRREQISVAPNPPTKKLSGDHDAPDAGGQFQP